MTEGGLETESRCRECLAIIKGEVTSNNLSKRRVRTRTHGVVGGRGLVAPSYPIIYRTMSCAGVDKKALALPSIFIRAKRGIRPFANNKI